MPALGFVLPAFSLRNKRLLIRTYLGTNIA